jgi:mannose-6-phosphate isomerase-like protein (cupin superfamily)
MSMKFLKHAKSAWKGKSQKIQKPWGHELVWSGHESVHGKILYIEAGCRTSLKYHSLKSETLLFLSGMAKVTFGAEHMANPGDELGLGLVVSYGSEEFSDSRTDMVQILWTRSNTKRWEFIEDLIIVEHT